MRSTKSRNIVIIAIWIFVATIAAYFLYNGVINGGFSFETKHSGEPTNVLYDITYDQSVKNVSITWVSGGVKILPTNEKSIRIVEKSYEPIDKDKYAEITLLNETLTIKTRNKPLFNFLGLMTRSTYLEVYLPISTSFSSVRLTGVSGNYSIDELYSDLTQITLTSGNLVYNNSFSSLLSLTMTSGNTVISDAEILSANLKMTSGNLSYDADTINFQSVMTSGNAEIRFGSTNPTSFALSMTSGSAKVHLQGPESFSVKVDKTSGVFNPNFDYLKDNRTYIHGSNGPLYTINMTSGDVDFTLSQP